jgi:hypothetical protein
MPDLEGLALPPSLVDRNERLAREREAVRLVWTDPASVAGLSQDIARKECQRLLGKLGLDVSWRTGAAAEIAREDEIRVILLDRAATDGRGGLILGATPANFPAARYVWIHTPGVRAAAGIGSSSYPALGHWRALGVALGRVIAHEIVHALAPSIPHDESGLMARRLRRAELVAGSLEPAPALALALRVALRSGVPFSPEAAGVLAAEHAAVAAGLPGPASAAP